MKKTKFGFICLLMAGLLFPPSVVAQQFMYMWGFNAENATNPTILVVGTKAWNVMDNSGPVFQYEGKRLEPKDYKVTLSDQKFSNEYYLYYCKATAKNFTADYLLKFKVLDDNSVEMLIESKTPVVSYSFGSITGDGKTEKAETGEHVSFAYYLPSEKLVVHCLWDNEFSGASVPGTLRYYLKVLEAEN